VESVGPQNSEGSRAVYRKLPDSIEEAAVAHGAREPGYWLKRK